MADRALSDRVLPDGVACYSRTPEFTADSVPDALLSDHDLKAGTWGRLSVDQGEVRFFLAGEAVPVATLQAGDSWVIRPQERHHIRVSPDAVLHVAFFR